MTVTAFTGHRPNKLGGYSPLVFQRLVALGEQALSDFTVSKAIVGMALGWDQAVAQACINRSVPFVAAIPFVGQESLWPKESRETYARLIAQAGALVTVSPGEYSAASMHRRDRWMVDNGQRLIALYDGSPSGTGKTVDYAHSVGVEVCNMWPFWAD